MLIINIIVDWRNFLFKNMEDINKMDDLINEISKLNHTLLMPAIYYISFRMLIGNRQLESIKIIEMKDLAINDLNRILDYYNKKLDKFNILSTKLRRMTVVFLKSSSFGVTNMKYGFIGDCEALSLLESSNNFCLLTPKHRKKFYKLICNDEEMRNIYDHEEIVFRLNVE